MPRVPEHGHDPVAALALGLVQRRVRAAEKPGNVRFARPGDRDPDAGSRANGMRSFVRRGVGDALPQRLRRCARAVDRGFRQHHQEFFAPPAAADVARAQRAEQRLPDGRQHGVARVVPVAIVDALEQIQIEQHDGQRALRSFRAAQFRFEPPYAFRARRAAGQRVDQRRLAHGLERFGCFQRARQHARHRRDRAPLAGGEPRVRQVDAEDADRLPLGLQRERRPLPRLVAQDGGWLLAIDARRQYHLLLRAEARHHPDILSLAADERRQLLSDQQPEAIALERAERFLCEFQ